MKILLIAIASLFAILFLINKIAQRTNLSNGNSAKNSNLETESSEACCGVHEICETDLSRKMRAEIIYYEDEDLDAYKNYNENAYNDKQIDEFREVLYSLKSDEIEDWLQSLKLRKIRLPSIIKSELLFMLANKFPKA